MGRDRRARVLIAEDHSETRLLYAGYLELLGFEVDTVPDGHSVIRVALEWRPDVVVMDLSLPHLDGWEATRRLKGDPRTAHIPIIACTGHALDGSVEAAIVAGCDAYVVKPCLPDELVREIRRILARVQRHQRPACG